MKHPRHEPTLMEFLKRGLEDAVDEIDLDEIHIPAEVMREIQRLNHSGDIDAAKDLYVSSVLNGVTAAEEKEFLAECARDKNREGGKKRGKQKTEDANLIRKWLYPLLAECEAELPIKKKNKGWVTMHNSAIRKVTKEDLDDPRKKYLTRSRIQAWIDEGRPKNWPG